MLLEFCAENFTKIPAAVAKGAKRIELCDNLAGDGTTPSYAVIEHTVKYADENDVTIATILRPRAGNFVYTDEEFAMMKTDLEMLRKLGSHGVVFGCLDENNRINREQTKEIIALSGHMETVFHMAFDHIDGAYRKEELDWLIEQGVTRILTHGGVGGTVFDHAEWLKEMIEQADGQIEILVGGGVTHENYEEMAKILPTDQFHGTKIVKFEEE